MITLMRKALDCLERKEATLKCRQVHLQRGMRLLKRLLRKILAFHTKRRMLKQFRRFQKTVPMGYNIKFQCRKIQGKLDKKLKDGTEIALTDKKKSKGSLSCSL